MKLYVPRRGDQLRLVADWRFELHREGRNNSFWQALGLAEGSYLSPWIEQPHWDYKTFAYVGGVKKSPTFITLPTGTVLIVDRIYIRKNAEDFDSITFRIASTPDPRIGKKKPRFWAKLADANAIEFESITEAV